MFSMFSNLPFEIQLQIFECLAKSDISYIRCRILVCKSWKIPNQKLLFKSIKISKASTMRKFIKLTDEYPDLGTFVKKLTLEYCIDEERLSDDELSNERGTVTRLLLCLPNLELAHLYDGGFFIELMWTVLDTLTHLNHVEPPSDGFATYTYIISKLAEEEVSGGLRDRLKHLSVLDLVDRDDDFPVFRNEQEEHDYVKKRGHDQFYKVFGKLEAFKKIESLHLMRTCNDQSKIDLLEKATMRCPLLNHLELSFAPDKTNRSQDHSISANSFCPKNVLPVQEVRYLIFNDSVFHSAKLIDYIILKFPQLNTLEILEGRYYDILPTFFMDELQHKRFLNYLIKIRYVSVEGIPYKNQILIDTIGSNMETLARALTTSLEFRFNVPINTTKLSVRKNDTLYTNVICCPDTINNLSLHSDIIIRYGKTIHNLTFHKAANSSTESVILEPLKHCVNLKRLTILETVLEGGIESNASVFRKESLQFLRFSNCTFLDTSVFEKVSQSLACIEFFQLRNIKSADNIDSSMDICMKMTAIGTLSLSTEPFFSGVCSRYKKLLMRVTTSCGNTYHLVVKAGCHRVDYQISSISSFEMMSCNILENFTLNVYLKSLQFLRLEFPYGSRSVKLTQFA